VIKIFFPNNLYDSRFRGDLFPLLKPFLKKGAFTDKERIAMYAISEKDFLLLNSIKKADWSILPMAWNYYKKHKRISEALDFIQLAKKENKKVLSFTNGDFGIDIPEVENIVVFRQSGERSKLPLYHKGIPSFIVDPLKNIYQTNDLTFNSYSKTPTIGFCGQTNSSLLNSVKEITGTLLHNVKSTLKVSDHCSRKIQSTSYLRSKVLQKIKTSSLLENQFIERKKYRAGATTAEQRKKTTLDFYNNIKNTDYTVCIRGAGNFSVRFYETLAMGRIPIFINTDCILPLADKINWKNHVVWVEENELDLLEEKVVAFHNQFTLSAFKRLQESNRNLWEEKLTLGGFFKD